MIVTRLAWIAQGWCPRRPTVRLGRLLEGEDRRRLEAEVALEVGRDLAHEALERQLAEQELRLFWYRRISRSATVPGR